MTWKLGMIAVAAMAASLAFGSSAWGAKGQKPPSDLQRLLSQEDRSDDEAELDDPKPDIWEAIKGAASKIVNCRKTLPQAVLDSAAFTSAHGAITQKLLTAKIPQVLKDVMAGVGWCSGKVLAGFLCRIPEAINQAKGALEQAGDWALKAVDYVATKLSNMVNRFKAEMAGYEELKETENRRSVWEKVKEFFQSGYDKVKGCWGKLKDWTLKKVANPGQSLRDLASWVCESGGSKLADLAWAVATGGGTVAALLAEVVTGLPSSLVTSAAQKSLKAATNCMMGK